MKRLSLLLLFLCAFAAFAVGACSQESIQKGVRLEVVDISEQKIRLKIANESKKTIFLPFQPLVDKQAKVAYSIFCKSLKDDVNYVDHGRGENLNLPLTPLSDQDYLLFDIENDLKMGSSGEMECEAKAGYYENEKVVALINQTASSAGKHLSEANSKRVKKEEKAASVKFVLK